MVWEPSHDDQTNELGGKGAPCFPTPKATIDDGSTEDRDDSLEAAIESIDTRVQELHLELSG